MLHFFLTLIISLFGCNQTEPKEKNDSFDAIVQNFFLDMNRKDSYSGLCKYFEDNRGLAEVQEEKGWTSNPPLSALGDESGKRRDEKTYKLPQYLNLNSQLVDGSLYIQKEKLADSSWSEVRIVLQFHSKKEAELFFIERIADLKNIDGFREENEFALAKGVSVKDKSRKDFLHVFITTLDEVSLYNVNILLAKHGYDN